MNVMHHKSCQHHLEDVGTEIVVQKESSVIEPKWQEVHQVSTKENLANIDKLLEQSWMVTRQ